MTSIFHFPSAFEGGGLSNKKFTILVNFFLFSIVDSLSSLKTPEKACFKSFLHRRQILEKKNRQKKSPPSPSPLNPLLSVTAVQKVEIFPRVYPQSYSW